MSIKTKTMKKMARDELEAEAIAGLKDIVVEGATLHDHPDYADAYVSSASWSDGSELTDDELDKLNDKYPEISQENAFESLL